MANKTVFIFEELCLVVNATGNKAYKIAHAHMKQKLGDQFTDDWRDVKYDVEEGNIQGYEIEVETIP